jgi:hypothetical protein
MKMGNTAEEQWGKGLEDRWDAELADRWQSYLESATVLLERGFTVKTAWGDYVDQVDGIRKKYVSLKEAERAAWGEFDDADVPANWWQGH